MLKRLLRQKNSFIIWSSTLVFLVSLFSVPRYLFIGGDDTKFYYLFPLEFFKNFALSIISNTSMGSVGAYSSHAYFALPSLYYWMIKAILSMLSLSSFLFPVIFSLYLCLGYVSFFLCLSLFVDDHSYGRLCKLLGGLLYAFSVIWIYSTWGNLLIEPLYCFSFFPLLIYLFIRGLQGDSMRPAVSIVLLFSLFPPLAVPTPWFLGLILTLSPLFTCYFFIYKKRFLKNSFFILVMSLVCNCYWVFPIIYGPTLEMRDNLLSRVSTPEYVDSGAITVKSVASTNELLYTAMNIPQRHFLENYSLPYSDFYNKYFIKFYLLNSLFFLLVLSALFFSRTKLLFKALLVSWLIASFFYTVKIDQWGIDFFIYLIRSVPLFSMFKNHYDKFAPSMVFVFAMLVAISSNIVLKNLSNFKFRRLLALVICMIVALNIVPQILWNHHKILKNQPESLHSKITALNPEIIRLSEVLKDLPKDARLLTLPLNLANYFPIADAEPNGLYAMGSPPFSVTVNKQTISGFMLPGKNGELLKKAFLERNYSAALKVIKELNIGYVLVSHEIYVKRMNEMLFSLPPLKENQVDPEFLDQILGNKIERFGDRYSLYEIKPSLFQSRVSISDETGQYNLQSSKFDGQCYHSELSPDFLKMKFVVLSEASSPGWKATLFSLGASNLLATSTSTSGLSNEWSLPDIKSQKNQKLDICFDPARFTNGLYAVAAFGILICFFLVLWLEPTLVSPALLEEHKANRALTFVGICSLLIFVIFIPILKIVFLLFVFLISRWEMRLGFLMTALIFISGIFIQLFNVHLNPNYAVELAYYCIPVLMFSHVLNFLGLKLYKGFGFFEKAFYKKGG